MPRGRKSKEKRRKRKKTRKLRVSNRGPLSKTQAGSVQKQIKTEKERLLPTLNFDEHLRGQVEDLFNINLEGIPAGKEPVFFSTAVFKIGDAKSAMTKIEKLPGVNIEGENEDGVSYVRTRAYPKRHWNPMSKLPGARQVIGSIQISYDNTMKLETSSKGWMTGLIHDMISVLGREVKLISLEFQNPMDMLRK